MNSTHPTRSSRAAGSSLVALLGLASLAFSPPSLAASASQDSGGPRPGAISLGGTGWMEPTSGSKLAGFGPGYRVSFRPSEVRFEPALGEAAERLEHLSLALESIARGQSSLLASPAGVPPQRFGERVLYPRAGGIEERWDLTPAGVEFSFRFPVQPAGGGDLVVRLALETSLGLHEPDGNGGLLFTNPQGAGVRVGGVLGIDAAGRTSPGTLSWLHGGLELRLPESFVESAAYPLVLDPLVGPVKPIQFQTVNEVEPDVVYDPGSDTYLVAWRMAYGGDTSDVRLRHVDRDGNPLGPALALGSASLDAYSPRLTSSPQHGVFAVAYTTRSNNGTRRLLLRTFHASTGELGPSKVVESFANSAPINGHDVAAYRSGAPSGPPHFLVVWGDPVAGGIRGRLMLPNPNNPEDIFAWGSDLISIGPNTIVHENLQPRLPRHAASDGEVLVVWLRKDFFGSQNRTVRGRRMTLQGQLLSPDTLLVSGGSRIVAEPNVDGLAGRWTVVWSQQPSSLSGSRIAARPVDIAPSGAGFSIGSEVLLTNQFSLATRPALSRGTAKSWVAYRGGGLEGQGSLRVLGIDGASCTPCESGMVLASGISAANAWATVASTFGQAPDKGNRALAVWTAGQGSNADVFAQVLANTAGGGSVVSLGGACGLPGTPTFPQSPSIGTNRFEFALENVTPGSPLAILTIGAPGSSALACGTCSLMLTDTSVQTPVLGTKAGIELSLPCLPQLVGSALDVQWLVVTPGTSPCPQFGDISVSNRLRLTLGE